MYQDDRPVESAARQGLWEEGRFGSRSLPRLSDGLLRAPDGRATYSSNGIGHKRLNSAAMRRSQCFKRG